jgi:hypothetical protein
MRLRRKARPAPEEPELLPAVEPTWPPLPEREASSVPHIGPGGEIKEPRFWLWLDRVLHGS